MVSNVLVLVGTLTFAPAASPASVDLVHVGHLPTKGRVQDQEPQNAVIASLIRSGPASIPFLVAQLTDEREVDGTDLWPKVHVGDVALMILCDFFTVSDRSQSTIHGMDWDELLERSEDDLSAWNVLELYVAAHGRLGLQNKVRQLLDPFQGRLAWDSHERCYRPVVATPPN